MRLSKLLPSMAVAWLLGCAPVDSPGAHFCCESVGHVDGEYGYGRGCVQADEAQLASCEAVIRCPGGFTLRGGEVTCPL